MKTSQNQEVISMEEAVINHHIDLGNGEPLVFIHGFASKKESWTHQFSLAGKYRIIAVDLRGHGESNITEGISINQFAKDVIDLLDHLNIEKAHFCGLSMGGVIIQEIYKQFPKRVKSMILSNTTSVSLPSSLKFLSPNSFKNLETIDESFPIKEYQKAVAAKCVYNKSNTALVEEVAKIGIDLKLETATKTIKQIYDVNYLPMLACAKVPILVIGGAYDEALPVFFAKQTYLATLRKADFVIIDKAGHMPNIECKEKYNEILERFLRKVS